MYRKSWGAMPFPAAFLRDSSKQQHSQLEYQMKKNGERKMKEKACGLLVPYAGDVMAVTTYKTEAETGEGKISLGETRKDSTGLHAGKRKDEGG